MLYLFRKKIKKIFYQFNTLRHIASIHFDRNFEKLIAISKKDEKKKCKYIADELRESIRALNKEIEKLKQEILELKIENNSLLEEGNKLKIENNNFFQENNLLKFDNNYFYQKNNNLKIENQNLKNEITKIKQILKSLSS